MLKESFHRVFLKFSLLLKTRRYLVLNRFRHISTNLRQSLLEKCLYSAFFSPYFSVVGPNVGKNGPEKLRIRILFTQ